MWFLVVYAIALGDNLTIISQNSDFDSIFSLLPRHLPYFNCFVITTTNNIFTIGTKSY